MAKLDVAYVDNTNNLLLSGLKSGLEGTYLNDGLVTVTVKDSSGGEVTGETWPLTMTYLDATDGNYVVALSADLDFTAGETYTAIIDTDASDTAYERKGHWEFPFQAKVRTS